MTLDNLDCGDTALPIADQSLFVAHSLLNARPIGLDENNLSDEMREFVGWAESEIEGHKRRIAERQREEREHAEQTSHFTQATEAYYLARLCQHLNGMDARIFWQITCQGSQKGRGTAWG